MKKIYLLLIIVTIIQTPLFSQIPLTTAPSGGNKKAWVGERVGLTDVTIRYDRPGVKGREGKIWGTLIPAGFTDPGFGTSKSSPWRAGANENTTIEFSKNVKIQGQPLAAGKYGFFIAYGPEESTLIFSKNSGSWGSYFYDEKEDALRVKIKPVTLNNSVEWLQYNFANETENSATIILSWEKLSFPFVVETNYVQDQVESFRQELRTEKGFIWQSWQQAALWCLLRNTNLDQALLWSDSATSPGFGGDRVFRPWATKAQILEKLNRQSEANEVMKKAMEFGSMNEIHQYGRQLISQKKNKEALDIFNMNYKKFPNQFTTLMGLTRGYSANGDFNKALSYAQKALPLAPDEPNRKNVEEMIAKLKEKKDIN